MSSTTQTIFERSIFNIILEIIFTVLLFILAGLIIAGIWAIIGLIFTITVIGFPLGKKCFSISKYAISPFNKIISYEKGEHKLANILWFPFGLILFVITFLVTALTSPLIIFIPSLRKYYKLWKMCFLPFSVHIEIKEK